MSNTTGDTGGVMAALARLAGRSADLSQLDDEYLRLISRTEEGLRGLNVGFYVTTEIDHRVSDGRGQVPDETFSRYLAFDKIGGVWRLAVRSGTDQETPDDWDVTALSSCDRDLRFEVFAGGHLEKLVLKALEVLEAAVAIRRQHLGRSTALVVAIEQARPARPTKGGGKP